MSLFKRARSTIGSIGVSRTSIRIRRYLGSIRLANTGLDTAEAIIERPGSYNLMNFSTVQFLAADEIQNTTDYDAYTSPTALDMSAGGTTFATAQGYGTYAGDSTWNDTQHHCD